MTTRNITETLEEVRRTLSSMATLGIVGFDPSPEAMERVSRWGIAEDPKNEIPPDPKCGESLEEIRAELGDCHRCPLCESRKNLVFGDGDPRARLVFVGEAPGYDEDIQGVPFVGKAGKLLTRIIQAMGLDRSQVYICNILKCRPPGNRNPIPEEIEQCIPFLKRQLDAISPDCICAMGKFAAQTLLETQTPISRLRGRFSEYNGIRLMPTYHPAYLLRNPEKKRDVWEDVQKIMDVLGLKGPNK